MHVYCIYSRYILDIYWKYNGYKEKNLDSEDDEALAQAVDSPSLEVFRTRLDGAWSNLGSWKVPLPHGRGGNKVILPN